MIPLQTEPIMFLTGTYTKELQEEKNIHYIFPDEVDEVPWGALTFKMNRN